MDAQQMRELDEAFRAAFEVDSLEELEVQLQLPPDNMAPAPTGIEDLLDMTMSFTSPNEAVTPPHQQVPGGPSGSFEHAGEMTFVEALMSDPHHRHVVTVPVDDDPWIGEDAIEAVAGLLSAQYSTKAPTEKRTSDQKQSQRVAPPSQPIRPPTTAQRAPAAGSSNISSSQSGVNRVSGRIAVVGNGYGDDLAGRPPVGALFPPGVQIGAIEILTFFPRWLHHPDVVLRLCKAGASRNDIAKVQLHAINQLTYGDMLRVAGRVQKQVSVAGKLKTGMDQTGRWDNKANLPSIPMYDYLTLDTMKGRYDFDTSMPPVPTEDMALADIAAPVMQGGNWPRGANNPDRLQMTQVLEYAYANPHLGYTLADAATIIQSQNIAGPGALDHNHDVAAFQRFAAAVPTPRRA